MQNSGDMPQDSDMEFWEKPSGISKMTIQIFSVLKPVKSCRKNGEKGPIPLSLRYRKPDSRKRPAADFRRMQDRIGFGDKAEQRRSDRKSGYPQHPAGGYRRIPLSTESIYIPSIDPETDHQGHYHRYDLQRRQAEMMEALDAIDSIKEAERKQRKSRKKAEKASPRGTQPGRAGEAARESKSIF